ncbi:acetate--CoA ligase family protein [Fodinicola feengrottensis]|uniref:Acetate--CoA ligase family protein n=1 Tax=Fodinicola feengrottensis TaxID=435914 RepID=A0ABP4T7R0_9ACTN
MPSGTGLEVFRDPASVAVVGASADPAKWGHWLASGALAGRHRRRVDLVNRGGGQVLGQRCVRRLSELAEPPELVALCVPANAIERIVDEALEMGVRGFVGIAAGVPDERQLAARIRAAGARLVGPNSLGIFDAASDLRLAWGGFTAGPLAIVSQSGQIGSEIATLGARQGIGIARLVSVGNQSDVTAVEMLADLVNHRLTRMIALYLESFAGGEALFETLRELRAAGKPTVVLTVGASAASSRLARSHTGSLTSSLDVVDAACRAAGVVRVQTPAQLVTAARAFLAGTAIPAGRRVAIVADSGGQGGIAADQAAGAGLSVPSFSSALSESIGSVLSAAAAHVNPVDLAGAGERELASYAETIDRALATDEVDGAILTGYFGCYGSDTPTLAERELEVAQRLGKIAATYRKPLVVHTMGSQGPVTEELWEVGVPAFPTIEAAVFALARLADFKDVKRERPAGPVRTTRIPGGYWAAREALSAYGIPFPAARLFPFVDDTLSPPYVLKAGWLDHKTEVGGIRVALADRDAVSAAYEQMRARLGDGEYVVEEQDLREDVVEMLVGVRRDPDFGLVVAIGAGGTAAQLQRDLAVELAPVSPETAAAMIDRLRCAPLLHGWRGRARTDVVALARLVAEISQLPLEFAELELNPVRVGPAGVLAVDVLLVPEEGRS